MKISPKTTPWKPNVPPIIAKTILSIDICELWFGIMYTVIALSAIIITPGGLTSPALTAVSPNIRAPTIDIAIPRYLGIRTLASNSMSNSTIIKNISKKGFNGRF